MDGVTLIASPRAAHQETHRHALASGFEAHGVSVSLARPGTRPNTHRVACWGWRLGRTLRAFGHSVLVMERGYLGDRYAWCSLAWNGLNGRGTVPEPPEDDGIRFNRNFGPLAPMDYSGRYVLIAGQVPGDAALGGRNLRPWYAEQAKSAANRYELPVRFRPHPLASKRGPIYPVPGAEMIEGTLCDALAGASVVVTFNSNVGVDALMAGKHATAADEGSMIWRYTHRETWARRLAWRQWTLAEIFSGFALEFVGVKDGA